MLVAGNDRTISPDLERWHAKRAKSHMVEVTGASHSVYISHPKEVAEVIESAARVKWTVFADLVQAELVQDPGAMRAWRADSDAEHHVARGFIDPRKLLV